MSLYVAKSPSSRPFPSVAFHGLPMPSSLARSRAKLPSLRRPFARSLARFSVPGRPFALVARSWLAREREIRILDVPIIATDSRERGQIPRTENAFFGTFTHLRCYLFCGFSMPFRNSFFIWHQETSMGREREGEWENKREKRERERKRRVCGGQQPALFSPEFDFVS